jgi:hypothetical protein
MATQRPPHDDRRSIARLVLVWNFVGLVLLGLAIMAANFVWDYLVATDRLKPPTEQRVAVPAFREVFDKIFGAVLPVVSAWVGAVLTYYFAQKNFESGSESTRQALAALPLSEALRRIPVADKMKPFAMIDAVHVRAGPDGPLWTSSLAEMREIFERNGRSRAPVFVSSPGGEGERVDSVVHESVFYRFLNRAREAGRDFATLTLRDLLDEPGVTQRVRHGIAFVSNAATLAEAKSAMDATPGCQDVFVTSNGRADGAVIGWLTNVDILRHSIAGAS